MVSALALLQALTNLGLAPTAPGLPPGWELHRVRGTASPTFAVTPRGTLTVTAANAAGFATFRLSAQLRGGRGSGVIVWRWRTATPLTAAALRDRARDDSPARVFVVFGDGRMIFYSWGNREARNTWFPSWTGSKRVVVVLRGDHEADGSWWEERRDPFADYRLMFARRPREIVAVGVGADSEQLSARTRAEVGALRWIERAAP